MGVHSPKKASGFWGVGLLFLVALGVRTWRAWQLPAVMPDAIRYIEQAQRLGVHPLEAVRAEVYHPLFSGAILLAHGVMTFWGSGDITDQRISWIHAAQLVGVFCGALMAPLLYWLSRRLGARPWAAAAAAGLWMVSKRTSAYGADGMSDMLALCLLTGSILWALRVGAFRGTLSRGQRGSIFLAGLLAGLAYLTRPEGLAAPLIVSGAWIVSAVMSHWRRGQFVAACWKSAPRHPPAGRTLGAALLILWMGVAIPALPYAGAIGGITHKKQLAPGSAAEKPSAALPPALSRSAPVWVWLEIAKTYGYVPMGVLLVTMALCPAGWGRPRFRSLIWVWAALWVSVMFWLLMTAGYLNGRHTLILQALLFPLFGMALQQWEARLIPGVVRGLKNGHPPAVGRHGPVVPAVMFIIVVATALPALAEPAWPETAPMASAAAWARGHLATGVWVVDRQMVVGYYSMHPYARWYGDVGEIAGMRERSEGMPVVLGKWYEPGQPAAVMIGSYQAIAIFGNEAKGNALAQASAALGVERDRYILYAIPGERVLKDDVREAFSPAPSAVYSDP